jgi:hypothetical protein
MTVEDVARIEGSARRHGRLGYGSALIAGGVLSQGRGSTIMMLFPPESLADVFSGTYREDYAGRCAAFAFVLATPHDATVFAALLQDSRDLDELTADVLCVFFARDDDGQIQQAFERGDLERCKVEGGRVVVPEDISPAVSTFIRRHSAETYAFARFVGIREDELPCVVIVDTLDSPSRYAYWSFKGRPASSVVEDFRTITRAIREARAKSADALAVDVVGRMHDRRVMLRLVGQALSIVPMLKNLRDLTK